MGMIWFFRYAAPDANGNVPDNTRTIHNCITGEKQCLERVDLSTGALKMAPVVKNKASQMWYIDFAKTKSDSIWMIQDFVAQNSAAMGGLKPTKLDVLTEGDRVVAKTISGNPINTSTNKALVEGTMWDVQAVRGATKDDDAGHGFST